jgi:energy-coupling factor transporter ATP-binding protein EcfA2
MSDHVLHPKTQKQLLHFEETPSHAVVISGPKGSGKTTIARQLATKVLQLTGDLNDYPYAIIVDKGKNASIGIESIREIEHFLSLRVPSNKPTNRVIIVEDSQLLTTEAQNALLKTLEEPPEGTLIILNSDNIQSLLPTIRSRVQSIAVLNPPLSELISYFEAHGNGVVEIKKAYSMSGGLPGLMSAMLSDVDHPLILATQKARELLGQSTYERLVAVDALAKDKILLQDVLFIMQQMAHVSLQSAQGPAAKQWQTVLSSSYETIQSIATSVQPKLALTKLMLSL